MIIDKIISITEISEMECIDIEVSGNHLFYANDILTHNSNSDVGLEDTSECIFVDEKIELRDGTIKKIGDVIVGEQIKANDEYKTVMLVHHKKMKKCFKVKLKSGKEIIVSNDHIFPTKQGRMSISTGLKIGSKLNSR